MLLEMIRGDRNYLNSSANLTFFYWLWIILSSKVRLISNPAVYSLTLFIVCVPVRYLTFALKHILPQIHVVPFTNRNLVIDWPRQGTLSCIALHPLTWPPCTADKDWDYCTLPGVANVHLNTECSCRPWTRRSRIVVETPGVWERK